MTTDLFFRNGSKAKPENVYTDKGKTRAREYRICGKCGGSGLYAHYGSCWTCMGRGGKTVDLPVYTAEKLTKLDAARDAKREKKRLDTMAAREARMAEFEAAEPELLAAMRESDNSFLNDLLTKIPVFGLNGNQIAAAKAAVERDRAYKAAVEARPNAHIGEVGERREFSGKVRTCYPLGSYCYGSPERYLMVIDTPEGAVKYIGSSDLGTKGDEVSFTATIKKHDEYKGESNTVVLRPAKIVINREEAA